MEFTSEDLGSPPDVWTWNVQRSKHPGVIPSLRGATISSRNLRRIDLRRADLRGASVAESDFAYASLSGAYLAHVDFTNASLEHTDLRGANFYGATLTGVSVRGATLGETIFCNVDLSKVDGLEECIHEGPSSVDFATLFRSEARIPERFLIGCGLAQPIIEYVPSLVGMLEPIQFYSCFISYAEKDREFAERLHFSLTSLGIRAWFAPEDMRVGNRISAQIDQAIRVHNKLLLIISRRSVRSAWVKHEVDVALERERSEHRTVLFPLNLDDTVFRSKVGWAADLRRTRHIADFSNWKDHDSYERGLSRLVRDLTLATSEEMSEGSDA